LRSLHSFPTRRSSDLLVDSVFEKDGKTIPYRKASLTREAEFVAEDTPIELTIREAATVVARKGRKRKAAAPAKRKGRQAVPTQRSEEHTSELQSRFEL